MINISQMWMIIASVLSVTFFFKTSTLLTYNFQYKPRIYLRHRWWKCFTEADSYLTIIFSVVFRVQYKFLFNYSMQCLIYFYLQYLTYIYFNSIIQHSRESQRIDIFYHKDLKFANKLSLLKIYTSQNFNLLSSQPTIKFWFPDEISSKFGKRLKLNSTHSSYLMKEDVSQDTASFFDIFCQ